MQREKKWTKGPWREFAFKKSIFIEDQFADSDIAEVDKDSSNAEANARLIAEAPKLVEALEDLTALAALYIQHDDAPAMERLRNARNVIAKAYGEDA